MNNLTTVAEKYEVKSICFVKKDNQKHQQQRQVN